MEQEATFKFPSYHLTTPPPHHPTIPLQDFSVCTTCRARSQSLWGVGALLALLVECVGFYVVNAHKRRAQASGNIARVSTRGRSWSAQSALRSGSLRAGLLGGFNAKPAEAGVLWALTVGLFGYFSFLVDSAWLVISTCVCPLMVGSAMWGFGAWAASDYSVALWKSTTSARASGATRGGAPTVEEKDEEASTELALRAPQETALGAEATETRAAGPTAEGGAGGATGVGRILTPFGRLAPPVQAALCFIVATFGWALLLFVCFAERFKWIAWAMAAAVMCLVFTLAAYVYHYNTQRFGHFFRGCTISWLLILLVWGLGTWQLAGEGAYDYFAISILFICMTYPALVISAYTVLDLIDNDWKLRRPVKVTRAAAATGDAAGLDAADASGLAVTHTELRLHWPTLAAFGTALLLLNGFAIGLVTVGGVVAGGMLLFGFAAVAMVVGGFVELRRRRYHLTQKLKVLLAPPNPIESLCNP